MCMHLCMYIYNAAGCYTRLSCSYFRRWGVLTIWHASVIKHRIVRLISIHICIKQAAEWNAADNIIWNWTQVSVQESPNYHHWIDPERQMELCNYVPLSGPGSPGAGRSHLRCIVVIAPWAARWPGKVTGKVPFGGVILLCSYSGLC